MNKNIDDNYCTSLTTILNNYKNYATATNHFFSLAIDSPVGTGKSTLYTLLKKEYTFKGKSETNLNKDHFVIAFDANAYDGTDSAYNIIVRHLNDTCQKYYFAEDGKSIYTNLSELLQQLTSLLVTTKLKNYLGDDGYALLNDAYDAIIKKSPKRKRYVLSKIKKIVDYLMLFDTKDEDTKPQEDADNNPFHMFRKQLQELFNEKKIYFFIDNIDSCNPHFAMDLFDCIKKLFDIPTICFIAFIDIEKFESNFTHRYGSTHISPIKQYFTIIQRYPAIKIQAYTRELLESMSEFEHLHKDDKERVITSIITLHENLKLSPKDIKSITQFYMSMLFKSKSYFSKIKRWTAFVLYYQFAILKTVYYQEYNDLIYDNNMQHDIIKKIFSDNINLIRLIVNNTIIQDVSDSSLIQGEHGVFPINLSISLEILDNSEIVIDDNTRPNRILLANKQNVFYFDTYSSINDFLFYPDICSITTIKNKSIRDFLFENIEYLPKNQGVK